MSSVNIVTETNNQLHADYDVSKIFVNNNRYESGTFLNASGGTLSYAPGTVLGRIAASNKLVPMASAAVDGSQYPVGILKSTITDLADAGEEVVNFCMSGDVVKEKLVLDGGDTLQTVVALKTIEDRIGADTVGVILVDTDELTGYDN